jgi:hypothetical protein
MPSCLTLRLFYLAIFLPCASTPLSAQSLKITGNPPGAIVELDGVPAGTTPFEKKFPGGYFHRTLTALGARLEHLLVVRISLSAHVTREIRLTDGPMDCRSARPPSWPILAHQVRSFRGGPSARFRHVLRQSGQADCIKTLFVLARSQSSVTADCFAATPQSLETLRKKSSLRRLGLQSQRNSRILNRALTPEESRRSFFAICGVKF